jgi:monofunctional biosynthetic peptidoglycan transglycosylase
MPLAAQRKPAPQRPAFKTWLFRLALAALLASSLPVLILRWAPPPASAFMLRASLLARLEGREDFALRYLWTPLEEISPEAGKAAVAAEDQLFFRHFGFDFKAMAKVLERNAEGGRLRGASTLSQQTAKNLFLYPGKSFLRKGLEAYFTALMEILWPKRRILEVYLNVAQFGDGVYGVEAASRTYFGKPARRLSAAEAALLAAVLPNPILLRANKPSAYVLKRRAWILEQMRRLGSENFPA